MEFSSDISLSEKRKQFFMKYNIPDTGPSNVEIILENMKSKVINVDDTPMQIKLITDKMIDFNQLKAVDNPIWFDKGRIPTTGGLFSEVIFGTTAEERRKTLAYIDLGQKFIHPYIYERLKKIFGNTEKICAGESSWIVNDEGDIIEIKDVNDSRYNEDNTGIKWFVKNFKKFKFKETGALSRKDAIELFETLKEDDIFISKWIVCPVFYRDTDMSSGRMSIPQINYDYNNLIKYTNLLANDDFGYTSNKAMFNIQMLLVKIRQYGQSLIEKKQGAFHKTVLGKSNDYGLRSVISVPVLSGAEYPDESPVDIVNTGVPLAQCCVLGYPFMIKWCLDFFRREFDGVQKKTIYRKDSKTGKVEISEVEIADQMSIYTKSYIHKKMKGFINTYGGRFEPIKIRLKDGTDVDMAFTGRGMSRRKDHVESSTISNRPMTWTDIFYMAAMETLRDKYIYTTRYPLVDYFGIFPSRCQPLSTVKTTPVMINGTMYPFYPHIDLSLSSSEITTQFIDTIELSNLYLKAIGGDYDGDMVSVKMVYSIEANREAEEIVNSLKHFVSIQGDIVRVIDNEAYLTFYNMTKY